MPECKHANKEKKWCDMCEDFSACTECQKVAMDRLVCEAHYNELLFYGIDSDDCVTAGTYGSLESCETHCSLSSGRSLPKEILRRLEIDTPSV